MSSFSYKQLLPIILLLFVCLLAACDSHKNNFFQNEIQKSYSPDKRCNFTITEYGDSSDAMTQLMLNFNKTGAGAGVYAVLGIHKDIKAYWKDNFTIVIKTKKTYNSSQKWPQVQNFDDIIKIVYIEK